MWQTLETKACFISQVMLGDTTVRNIEDLDSPALSYAEVKAIASGNPLVLEKAQIDADVMRLSVLKAQHEDSQFRVRSEIRAIERRTPGLEERAGKMITDSFNRIELHEDHARLEGLKAIDNQKFEHENQLTELLTQQKEFVQKLLVDQEPQVIESEVASETVKLDQADEVKSAAKVS